MKLIICWLVTGHLVCAFASGNAQVFYCMNFIYNDLDSTFIFSDSESK